MGKILIKGGRVLNPADGTDAVKDVLLAEGKILAVEDVIDASDDRAQGAEVLEATDRYVMPGFVDLHVHLRDPGLTYKEDLTTGAAAAARGGVTTVCAMPNTKPVVDNVETLQDILTRAKELPVRIEQIAAVTKGQNGGELTDMEALKKAGAVSFSEDGKSVMDVKLCAQGMEEIARLGMVFMDHCEDKDLVGAGALNAGVASEKYGVPGITNSVENIIEARDIFLSSDYGTKLHLCHCTTKESVELVRMAKNLGLSVTAEVCPHHFTLTDSDIDEENANFKMNPPLRTEADVQALIRGLADGTMDVIATDHAPHSAEEKAKDFAHAPFGIVGLETSASLTYTALVETGILSPLAMAEKMSYNPAKVISLEKERGNLTPGALADVVIFDPKAEYEVKAETFASKGKNTPYDGKVLKGKVVTTICRGEIVYQEEA